MTHHHYVDVLRKGIFTTLHPRVFTIVVLCVDLFDHIGVLPLPSA